jgi:hypothetical protein
MRTLSCGVSLSQNAIWRGFWHENAPDAAPVLAFAAWPRVFLEPHRGAAVGLK